MCLQCHIVADFQSSRALLCRSAAGGHQAVNVNLHWSASNSKSRRHTFTFADFLLISRTRQSTSISFKHQRQHLKAHSKPDAPSRSRPMMKQLLKPLTTQAVPVRLQDKFEPFKLEREPEVGCQLFEVSCWEDQVEELVNRLHSTALLVRQNFCAIRPISPVSVLTIKYWSHIGDWVI
ncbi:MAG: hypothetical protein EZS28_015964 [Streblomastix strix]|uniref:Uncharacterized protein n=1 Tax=Streblomastix strix TaxID=222440 RepID=A0A5J4W221_9EUKA|nr:MAG: hypothetical protein EZS28_015964 [Streblomastix strix]